MLQATMLLSVAYRNLPEGCTASATGKAVSITEKGDPATGLSAPVAALIVNADTVLLKAFAPAEKRNFPNGCRGLLTCFFLLSANPALKLRALFRAFRGGAH